MARARKKNPKRRMPPALKAYWAARNKRLRNPKRKAAKKRRRNPLPTQHILFAQRPAGPVLKYLGGIKFSQTGRPVKFASKADAIGMGRQLRQQFRILKTYKLWST
jgi:hypothetical protein